MLRTNNVDMDMDVDVDEKNLLKDKTFNAALSPSCFYKTDETERSFPFQDRSGFVLIIDDLMS